MCCKRTIPGKLLLITAAIGLVIGVGRFVVEQAQAEDAKEEAVKETIPAVLNFEMNSLAGDAVQLEQYHGDVV